MLSQDQPDLEDKVKPLKIRSPEEQSSLRERKREHNMSFLKLLMLKRHKDHLMNF
jgi:hypothetical protein